jgi:hypothetical protein
MRARHDPHDKFTTIVPHESLGADCCGCIVAVNRGDEADLVCNECNALIRTVPAAQAELTLFAARIFRGDLQRKVSALHSAECIFRSSAMNAFTCRECGEGVATAPTLQ